MVRFGRTAAWSFDLARSTAYVRQGDPAFAGLDRDGQAGYRTNDIFFQTIDLDRVGVPHADVQMRLFSRVICRLARRQPAVAAAVVLPGHRPHPADSDRRQPHRARPSPYALALAAVESVGARI